MYRIPQVSSCVVGVNGILRALQPKPQGVQMSSILFGGTMVP